MARKKKVTATVVSQARMADQIYDMWLETGLAADAEPGQFVAVYPKNAATLLPRPISICEVDRNKGRIRLVYQIAGKGTAEFSSYQAGEKVAVLGVLGNGFPAEKAAGKRVFLIGGGIGIPPMLELAKALNMQSGSKGPDAQPRYDSESLDVQQDYKGADVQYDTRIQIILGYRNSDLFLHEELQKYGQVYVASEDGSVGTKGNVMDAIREHDLQADIIMACGPMPMLRAIKAYAEEKNIEAYLSLEERMACGVGVCLGCVCKTKEIDHHSHVHNARICTDGPVFEAKEVDI